MCIVQHVRWIEMCNIFLLSWMLNFRCEVNGQSSLQTYIFCIVMNVFIWRAIFTQNLELWVMLSAVCQWRFSIDVKENEIRAISCVDWLGTLGLLLKASSKDARSTWLPSIFQGDHWIHNLVSTYQTCTGCSIWKDILKEQILERGDIFWEWNKNHYTNAL